MRDKPAKLLSVKIFMLGGVIFISLFLILSCTNHVIIPYLIPDIKHGYTVAYHAVAMDGTPVEGIVVPKPISTDGIFIIEAVPTVEYDENMFLFKGWSTSSTEFSQASFPYTVSEDTDFYAVFISKSVVGTDDGITYTYSESEEGYSITDGSSASGAVIIPATIDGVPIIGIDTDAFYGNSKITSIDLSGASNLKTIGSWAFGGMSELKGEIIIPSGVISIGDAAFANSPNISSLTIPASLETAGRNILQNGEEDPNGDWVFPEGSSITVIFEDGIENLSERTFLYAPIKSITIPASITEIPAHCFGESALESVTFEGKITSIGSSAFFNCAALKTINGLWDEVEYIGNSAFSLSGIDGEIDLPAIKELGNYAFNGTAITSATLGEQLKEIPNGLFSNCSSLSNVVFSDDIESIGDYAFQSCTSLTSIFIPESVLAMGIAPFEKWTGSQTINIEIAEESVPSGWDVRWKNNCEAIVNWSQERPMS